MDSSLLLVALIQMQDLQTLHDAWECQGQQNCPPVDDEFAMALQEALLAADMQVMCDRRLAQSLERSGDLYGEVQDTVVEEAMRVVHDHERLSTVGLQSSIPGAQSPARPGFERSVHESGKLPLDCHDL